VRVSRCVAVGEGVGLGVSVQGCCTFQGCLQAMPRWQIVHMPLTSHVVQACSAHCTHLPCYSGTHTASMLFWVCPCCLPTTPQEPYLAVLPCLPEAQKTAVKQRFIPWVSVQDTYSHTDCLTSSDCTCRVNTHCCRVNTQWCAGADQHTDQMPACLELQVGVAWSSVLQCQSARHVWGTTQCRVQGVLPGLPLESLAACLVSPCSAPCCCNVLPARLPACLSTCRCWAF
jgi:hypothetical protein